jgi:two-component system nitrogen regulation sensor histidine kinase GlnL
MTHDLEFKKLLDSLLSAVVVLDQELCILYINTSAEDLMQVSGKKLIGKQLGQFFHAADTTWQSLQEAQREDASYTKRQAQWLLHNNHEIVVDYSVTIDSENERILIEIQPLDRLLRISQEEAWQATHETTSHMVRSMAHEIKNPLGGIRGAAQLLERELRDSELNEFTKIIIGETDRLRNLTDRMLGPNQPVRHRPCNIHEVLQRVASVVALDESKDVRLIKDYDPSIPDLLADKEQLIQAVMNIVRNAQQALTENAVEDAGIHIKTRVQRRYTIGRKTHDLVAQVTIADNGPGIPPDMIKTIFYPMISGRAKGTGLGLAIAQNLIHRHEGFIECQSEPGNTEFAIYLPLEVSHA